MFKVDGLQCQIFLNPAHMQSLHIKITQIPPNMPDSKPYQWSLDDLQILEQFFELRVAAPPFRPMSLCGFVRMLSVPPQVLKDFIQIIRIELMPELAPNLKWNVQFCVRVPPSAAPIVPIGNAAIHMIRSKILFFVSFVLCIRDYFFYIFAHYTVASDTNTVLAWHGYARLIVCAAHGVRCKYEYNTIGRTP